MMAWLEALREIQEPAMRVTVLDVRGSAPREIGATMIVTAEDLAGSIGGGQLEYECTRIATKKPGRSDSCATTASGPAPITGSTSFTRTFPLGASMGQCCGGIVDVLFEYIAAERPSWVNDVLHYYDHRVPAVLVTEIGADGDFTHSLVTASDATELPGEIPAAARRIIVESRGAECIRIDARKYLLEPVMSANFDVALFGAGHVGSALVNVLAGLDLDIRWVDSRRNMFPDAVPRTVQRIDSRDPAREVLAMLPGTYYLVMTHSHALDYAICEQILARDDFAYCGLIGSRSKRRRFESLMSRQGMSKERLDRLTCPIGIAGVAGKKPQEIAIAVAAELLQRRHAQSSQAVDVAGGGNVHLLRR
jgi:xanthine dehydrogenase accessory factor